MIRRRPCTVLLAAAAVAAAGAAGGAAAEPGPSAAQLAGQRVVWSFPGRTPPAWLLAAIRRGEVGSILLFADNGDTVDEVRALVDRLQDVPRPVGMEAPLLVMADQEGGAVRRIQGPPVYGADDLAGLPVAVSAAAGDSGGDLLCRAGVNVDLAPVVDLARDGSVIADQGRSFGRSPAAVSARAVAFARGLAQRGVAAAPKHFPGLGAAGVTTDEAAVRITLSAAQLRGADERPYAALVRRGVPMVMVSTAVYTAFGTLPAALNRRVVTGELVGRLGFTGVTIADALDTPALRPVGGDAAVARAAAAAGTDLLPFVAPARARTAAAGLRDGLRRGTLARSAALASYTRVMQLRWSLAFGVALVSAPQTAQTAVDLTACSG